MTKTSKLKSGGIILSFITLTIIILFGFRFLDKRLKTSEINITNELTHINWANIQEDGEGFQPKYIEEYISQDKNEINNLINDLNKVRSNGESESVQRMQQEIILLIHEFPDPKDLEGKVPALRHYSTYLLKDLWSNESEYSLKKNKTGATYKANVGSALGDRGAPQVNMELYTLDFTPNGSKYVRSKGHHNRLKPNKNNNFVADINDWKKEFDKEFFDDDSEDKKSLFSRILYTNKSGELYKHIIRTRTDEREGGGGMAPNDVSNPPPGAPPQNIVVEEFVDSIIRYFNPDSEGNIFSRTYERLKNNASIYKKGEKPDPYYRILYPGYSSTNPEASIVGDKFWPFYEQRDTDLGTTQRNSIINSMDEVLTPGENAPHHLLTIGNTLKTDESTRSVEFNNLTPFIFKGNQREEIPSFRLIRDPKKRKEILKDIAYNKSEWNIFSLFNRGKGEKNARFQFLSDPITRHDPIWPLDLPVTSLHDSKGPILKDTNGSFLIKDMFSFDAGRNGKFFETKIIGLILSKIENHKKIFTGLTFAYLTTSIYYLIHLNNKSKRKKNESLQDYKKRTKKTNKIKKYILVLFPISYYVLGLFSIVSYFRWRQTNNPRSKTNSILNELRNMENSSKGGGKSLFTDLHINVIKKKISYYEDLSIKPLKLQSYISSGLGIFSISFMLYIILQIFKYYPMQSKLASIIISFIAIVGIVGYLLLKYKNIILTFIPETLNIFGTKKTRDIIIYIIILFVLVCILVILFSKNKFINFKTNGRILLDKETTLSTSLKLGKININNRFSISSWFYFVASSNSNSNSYKDYSTFFNMNWNPIMMINTQNGNLKVIFEDKTLNQQIIYDSPIQLQKWNNIVINYDGSTFDIFINSKLVASKKNIYIDNELTYMNVGNINNINSKICYENSKDPTCKTPRDNIRCVTKTLSGGSNISCGSNNCKDSSKKYDCKQTYSSNNVTGGMANIVYYDNILKLDEIYKNYEIFNQLLKNKVY